MTGIQQSKSGGTSRYGICLKKMAYVGKLYATLTPMLHSRSPGAMVLGRHDDLS